MDNQTDDKAATIDGTGESKPLTLEEIGETLLQVKRAVEEMRQKQVADGKRLDAVLDAMDGMARDLKVKVYG